MGRAAIDVDVGLTEAQQLKRFNEIFGLIDRNTKPKSKTKAKPVVSSKRQPKTNNSLKPKAIELFQSGKSVKEVSSELGITYANANYYKRFA